MAPHRPRAATAFDPYLIPPALAAWLSVFRSCFTTPVWNRVLVLVAGAVLAPGKRTVTQALRVMGLAEAPQFRRYHELLGRARWDARAVARRLLLHLLDRLPPSGPVVIGIDDAIERRWGARIKARGIYRDPARSSKGHFVKTSGLRWLSLMVVAPISWSGRHWALPFLTILAPSARWSETHRERHKTLTDWARQAIPRVKPKGMPADQTLVAQPSAPRRRRQRLRGTRTAGCGSPPRLSDHPAAAGCRAVQASATASDGPTRPPALEGTPTASPQYRPGQQEDRLDNRGRLPMVQRAATQAADRPPGQVPGGRLWHRRLVPRRHPPCPRRLDLPIWRATRTGSPSRTAD
jgi:hypothetical protein